MIYIQIHISMASITLNSDSRFNHDIYTNTSFRIEKKTLWDIDLIFLSLLIFNLKFENCKQYSGKCFSHVDHLHFQFLL